MSRFQNMQVNRKVARLNAVWVFIFSMIFIFIPAWRWIVFVLLVNFFIKGFFGPWYSPISQVNKAILKALKVEPEMIFAPPKIFAAKVGFVFSLVASILYLLNYQTGAIVVIAILSVFAFLELAFLFCMGCVAHSFIKRTFGNG